MTAVTTLMSKTQNKVIVEVQTEERILKRLLELLTVTFETDVRIKRQIKEKFCFATEGDVGRVCHSACHHVKNISWYDIQNFRRLQQNLPFSNFYVMRRFFFTNGCLILDCVAQ